MVSKLLSYEQIFFSVENLSMNELKLRAVQLNFIKLGHDWEKKFSERLQYLGEAPI